MSQNIQTSLVVTGQQGLPPFRAISNNGLDAFAVGADGYVYIYNITPATISPTYSFLVLGSSGKIEYTEIVGLTGATGSTGNPGTSGTSGSSGSSGTSGTSGSSGSSGTSGSSGSSGIDGTSGVDGGAGSSGTSGTSGTSGISGSSGTSGTSGSSGTSGTSGSSGTSGTSGSSGTSGTSGSSGTSGTSGSSGSSGVDGTSGVDGATGATGVAYFNNTDTITFVTQSVPGGVSASAYINTGSLTASHLNTGSNGGATAGYILSNTNDGNFAWVPASTGTSLAVADYGTGNTFSGIENIIFRGGVVTGHYQPTVPTGTASGVSVTGPSPTVTVWIPAPPAAVYASHFNTTDGNTTGTVTRTLTTATVRISTPTSEGTPFETGSSPNTAWAGTNQASTTTSTPTFQTTGSVTGFSANSGGDARIIVDVFRANGVATFSTYTTPTLYQNATHTNSAGISVTIGSYATDDSGFPAIYPSKYKATVSVSVNMSTIFTANSLDGGRYSVRIKFITDTATDGGSTYTATSTDVFYDTNPNTPSISGSTTIIESTNSSNILTKHISGVEYYITGSQFEITTTNINNLNKNTQGFSSGVTKNFTITGTNYNLPSYNLTAWSPSVGSFVGWLNNYDNTGITFSYTSWAISSSSTFRYRGAAAVASAQPFDPWGSGSAANSTGASVLIDQVSDNSTRLGESFTGETERLVRGSSTFSAWDSTATLGTAISNQTGTGPFCDACVVGGYLVRPDKYFLSAGLTTLQPNLTTYKPNKNGTNPDYSGSGYQTIATYHRRFYTTSGLNIPSFTMTFSGTVTGYTDFNAALSASQLKVYIRRISSPTGNYGPTANPLCLHGSNLYNSGVFDDNGTTDTAATAIRTTNSGNAISGTFGGYPANVGFWMELQIVDSAIKIDYINVTLTFSNGSTDSSAVGAG